MLKKVNLPGTDLQVSQLCYGTNMLGTAIDQPGANAILDRFTALGGNFLDTARSYGDWIPDAPAGASERAIGAWLKGKNRDDVVIATKGAQVDMRSGDYRNRVTPEDIASDLAESLDHLGIDTIDLYWLHADNPQAPVGPIMDALFAHQDAGKIRYIGASNWTPERIREANAYAASKGRQGFVASQTFWGLAAPEREASTAQGYQLYYEDGYQDIHAEGVTMIPYSAQSGGYFTKLAAGGEAALPDFLKARYANPVNAKMGATNDGSLQLVSLKATGQKWDATLTPPQVVNAGALTLPPSPVPPATGAGVTLTFNTTAAGTTFTLAGNTAAPIDMSATPPKEMTAPYDYIPGKRINIDGWEITLQGSPKTGDTVTVGNAADPQYGDFYQRDAGNASALMALRDAQLFDGATLADGFAGAMAQVGTRTQSAQFAATLSSTISANLERERAAVSGVNLDEEAARLIQYQQAYQASAKMIQIAQNIFDNLIQSVGR